MNRPTTFALGTALTSAGVALAVLPSLTGRHPGSHSRSGGTDGRRNEFRATAALRGFAEAFDIDLDALTEAPAAPPVLASGVACGPK